MKSFSQVVVEGRGREMEGLDEYLIKYKDVEGADIFSGIMLP